jgi:hypothetical protein
VPEFVETILSNGPMGLVAGIFIYLYLNLQKQRDADAKSHSEELAKLRKEHADKLDGVRESQISREQEISRTLEEYGRSTVVAVDQTTFLAKELRRIHDRERE